MKKLEIKAVKRTELGKKATKKLRAESMVPCVLYGAKVEQNLHFYAHELIFRDLIYTHLAHIVELDIDGDKRQAILQDINFHPVTDKIIHCDFLEVSTEKPVIINIPVATEGVAIGVKEGGKLHISKRNLKVKANLEDLPDVIKVNVEKLAIGQNIKVKDLQIDKLQILEVPGVVVAAVRVMRMAIVEEEEGAEKEGTEAEGKEGEAVPETVESEKE